ncbi:MAG TPA: class I SAM-dependent methyltransferase [Burkholderiales bacterium]
MLRRFALALAAWLAPCCAAAQDAVVPAPFIRTPDEVVRRMLELAEVGPRDVVIDLGSGDGRIVIAAARDFGARGIGIDRDAGLLAESRRNARAAGVAARVRFVEGDVLTADLSQASVVTAYLLPELMWRLRMRFLSELRPGARVVSHAFGMPGWPPDHQETLRVRGPHPGQGATSTLYLWIVPADVRGEWRSGEARLRIVQSYQHIEVEGASRAALRGREISWQSPQGRFRGRVEDERIVGRFETQDGSRELTFVRSP